MGDQNIENQHGVCYWAWAGHKQSTLLAYI